MTHNNKLKALIFLFIALIVATSPIAQAQIYNVIGGVGGVLGGLPNLIHINGSISCPLDGSTGVVNGVAIPPFPDAMVQLRCGGNVVASARTNANGVFNILLDPQQTLVQTLLSNCNIIVMTPLSICNPNLPSSGALFGGLNLQPVVGNVVNLVHGFIRYIPTITMLPIN